MGQVSQQLGCRDICALMYVCVCLCMYIRNEGVSGCVPPYVSVSMHVACSCVCDWYVMPAIAGVLAPQGQISYLVE